MRARMTQRIWKTDGGRKYSTHTVGLGATLTKRRDPAVESTMATTVSKKSGAVQIWLLFI